MTADRDDIDLLYASRARHVAWINELREATTTLRAEVDRIAGILEVHVIALERSNEMFEILTRRINRMEQANGT